MVPKAIQNGWIRVLSVDCPVHGKYFLQAMELLIQEPNISSPSILRAEIVYESNIEAYREIIRKIVPKQDRDPIILQNIQVLDNERGIAVVHFVHGHYDPTNQEWDSIKLQRCSPDDLPFFYPKFNSFRYCFENGVISIDVEPYPNMESLVTNEKYLAIWERIAMYIRKIAIGISNGYQKRVHHDQIVPKIEFQDLYGKLKAKYKHWVSKWEAMGTDPQKHVFEDVAIATFLMLLWKQSPLTGNSKQFVDLGCGNGFLTHILTNEGYNGYGIDLWKRKQWEMFPEAKLIERAIDCPHEVFDDVEWIVGNHPDELTLWIPIMAAKADCKFIIIPCCFHQLDGSKVTKYDSKLGRYLSYSLQVEDQCKELGFNVEREYLRIPSTKNLCLIARKRQNLDAEKIISKLTSGVNFKLRKTDREKTKALQNSHKPKATNLLETKTDEQPRYQHSNQKN